MNNENKSVKTPKRILVIRNDHLGDLILSTGVFRELKKEYPNSKISVIVSDITKPIIEKNKNIDEIIALNAPKKNIKTLINYLRAYRQIKKQNFDIGIDLKGGLFTTFFLLWLPKIKKRIAPDINHKRISFLLTDQVNTNFFQTDKHEIKRNLEIINKGLRINRKNYMPEIITDEEDKKIVERFMKKNCLKNFICICPIATTSYKQWDIKNYEELVSQFNNLKIKILILGIKKDKEDLEKIANKNKNCLILMDFNVRQLSLLLKKSRLVVSNDGGVMHVAWVSGAKLIAIFAKYPEKYTKDILEGKTISTFLRRVFPLKNSVIIQSKGNSINDVSIEEVKTEIKKVLK